MKILKTIFLLTIFPIILVSSHLFAEESPKRRGVIIAAGQQFSFEKSYDFVKVYDSNHKHTVFSTRCPEKNTLILDVGFSDIYNSFYVFKQKFTSNPVNFELNIEFEGFSIPIINNSDTAFYSPVFVESDNNYVLYISEDFSIVQYDIDKIEQRTIIKSKTPLKKLSKNHIQGRETIEFYKFIEGNYKKFFLYTDHLGISNIKYFPIPIQSPEPMEDSGYRRTDLNLDYKKIIGFGDSITVGEIKGYPIPELGYVPRLESLVQEQLYEGANVINEGVSSLNTEQGVARIESVILNHQGKFLLFHLGTNDVISYDLPISITLANIEFMIKTALEYNLQPILSTLIPRYGGTREELKRYRGKLISDGIAGLSESLNLPLVDFWDTFLNYPESDGGYFSLMSDKVHPSEKGYQLMAEEWLIALLACPPQTPWNILGVYDSRYKITLTWGENVEKDFSHYLIKFGFSPDHLYRTTTSPTPICTLLIFPFQALLHPKTYFSIQAVDMDGHGSEFSPIQILDYWEDNPDSIDLFNKHRKERVFQQ
jgi:lysophospholipase L1-like esterase